MRILLLVFASILSVEAISQDAISKTNNALYQADRVQGTVNKLKGLFGKKKQKPVDTAQSVKPTVDTTKKEAVVFSDLKTTMVLVYGIDYSKLKEFNENIKACSVVESTVMKFDPDKGSTIKVAHKGTSENLLKLMGQTSKDIFTDKNLTGFEEGNIALKL